MDRFMPVSAEILTRVILLYEKEFKNGIRIWKDIEENDSFELAAGSVNPLLKELTDWMEQLQAIFSNMEPYRRKGNGQTIIFT